MMSRAAPPSTIVSTPRIKDDDVTLYSPTGEAVTVTRDNARDLITHHGYTKGTHKEVAPSADEQEDMAQKNAPKPEAKTAEPVVSETAIEIARLRAAATARGIEVDQRWGLKKLQSLFPQG